jgi:tetratricopeptide (TPR) repeat protein
MRIKLLGLALASLMIAPNPVFAGSTDIIVKALIKGLSIASNAGTVSTSVHDFIDDKKDISKSIEYKNEVVYVGDHEKSTLSDDKRLSNEYRKMAWDKAKLGDHASAADLYKKSLEYNANSASAWHGYGWSLSELGDFEKANNAFMLSLKLRKNDETWRFLGWNYERQSAFPEARECYLKALALNPNNEKANTALNNVIRSM